MEGKIILSETSATIEKQYPKNPLCFTGEKSGKESEMQYCSIDGA